MANRTTSAERGPGRLLLFGAGALLLSVLLTLVVAELFIRLLMPQPVSWAPVYRRHPTLPFYATLPEVEHRLVTGETDWTIVTDERGFRIDPARRGAERDPETRCRALWLGDSFTFGNGVDYPESFVGLIDRDTPGMAHLNAGVPGYGPVQYRQTLEYWLEQGLSFDRLYVATFLGNDFHDTRWSKDVAVVDGLIGNEGGLDSWLKQTFHLRRLLANLYHQLAPSDRHAVGRIADDLANPDVWQQDFLATARTTFAREMARVAELARAEGAEIGALVLPTREAVAHLRGRRTGQGEAPPADRDPLLPVREAVGILEGLSIETLDLTPVLAREPTGTLFFRFDGHYKPRGNRLVADAFLERFGAECADGDPIRP